MPPTQGYAMNSIRARILLELRRPVPLRIDTDSAFQWILDSLVAVVLWILGIGVAGMLVPALSFLEQLAYTTALTIGWFPIGMWMHYCRVSSYTGRLTTILILGPLMLAAVGSGNKGVLLVPIALIVLSPVLMAELMIGKRLLELLPASNSRIMTEQRVADEALDQPF